MKKFISYIMIFAIAACMFAGCGGAEEPAAPANVVCVVGAVNNNPVVDAADIDELTTLVKRPGSTYSVINAEGSPRVICEGEIESLADTGYTKNMLERIYASKAAGMKAAINEAAPITAEVDIAAATEMAVRSIRLNQADDRDNILIYYLSGISTQGIINMVETPVCEMDIESSVSETAEKMGLDMNGIKVIMYCCGDVAGADQSALSPTEKNTLKEFYEKLFLTMGASSVTFMDDLPSSGSYDFDQKVSVMAIAKVDNGLNPFEDGKIVEFGEEDIAFLPDSTELADEDAAMKALDSVIEYMKEDEEFELLICGTTTSAGEAKSCMAFSEKRAEAIRDLLVNKAGIDEDRIQILGCGWSSMLYTPDRTADGSDLDETIAPANRSVKMVNANSDMAQDIRDSLKDA